MYDFLFPIAYFVIVGIVIASFMSSDGDDDGDDYD